MTANKDLILGGQSGGGTAGTAMANFAPVGSTMPTDATTALDAAFKDAGWIDDNMGLKRAMNQEVAKITAVGAAGPVRVFKSRREVTFQIKMLESNTTALEVFHELPLGTIDVDTADGSFDFTEGASRSQQYAAVFDIVDGLNHIRAIIPALEQSGQAEQEFKPGTAIGQDVTFTAYPGSDGIAVHWFYVIDALIVTP